LANQESRQFAVFGQLQAKPDEVIVVNLSGRGDKDLSTYQQHLKLND
jgi:tryptophan synthase beta chain